MKRVAIATTCLLGATVPVLFAIVFYFGCCVLPFHHAMHHLMPICTVARQMVARGRESDERQMATPGTAKDQQADPRAVTSAHGRGANRTSSAVARLDVAASAVGYRSFISLGATRCDADVGAHLLLLDTFRI